jgi:translocation and assembly module TamB
MHRGRLLHRVALGVVATIVILVVIVPVTALLALQNRAIAGWAATRLLALVNPYPGRVITVRGVTGDWWSGLTLTGIRLEPTGRSPAISIDTIRARYASPFEVARSGQLASLEVAGLSATATQSRTGAWDLLTPFARHPPPVPPPNPAARTLFAIGRVSIRRAALIASPRADTAPGRRHAPFRLGDLLVNARDVQLGTSTALRLDTLHARIDPATPGLPPLALDATGSLADGRLQFARFAARGGGSAISAHGSFTLPDSAHPHLRNVNVVLDAQPVRFADLSLLVAGLAPHESATLHVEARGASDTVQVAATAELARGGHAAIGGVITTAASNVFDSLDVRLRDVEPKALLASATDTGTVTGTLAVRVRGAMLRTANGTAALDLAPTVRYGSYTVRNLSARAVMTTGVIRATLRGTLRPWRLTAAATLAPFDTTRAHDIRAHVVTVGTHPAALDSADVHATLRAKRIAFALRAAIAGGTAAATGDVTLGAPLAWRVTNGTLTRVNLARVTGDTSASALTGRFTATGRGTSLASALGQARIHLASSTYGAIRLRRADASLAMRGGVATVAATAALDTGTIAMDASVTPGGAHPAVVVRRLAFAHVDAGRLAGDMALSTDLTGALTGRAAWRAGAAPTKTLRGTARLTLARSRAGSQRIDSASATVAIGNGTATWHASAAGPHATLALGGAARPFASRPSFTVDTGTVRGLDLAGFTGRPDLHTKLDVTVTARIDGLDPDSAHWRLALALAPSVVRGIALDSVKLGVALDTGTLHVAAGVAAPDGRGSGAIDGRLVAPGDTQKVSLARILAEADLRLYARANWRLAEAAPDTAIMLASVDTITLPRDSGIVALRLTRGRVAIDTLDVRSVLGTLTGTGSAAVAAARGAHAPPSNLRLVLDTRDLTPVAQVLGLNVLGADSARLALTVTGTADTPQVHVVARARGIAYNTNRVDALDADIAAAVPGLRRLAGTTGTVRASDGNFAGLAARELSVKLAYADSLARVSVAATLDDGTTASLVAAAAPDSVRSALRLDSLTIDHTKDHWRLTHPVPITYGARYAIKDFVLASNTGPRIAIDGSVGRSGTERLTVLADSVSLSPLARALGRHALAGATLVGTATLDGTASAPRLHADAVIVLPKANADSGTVHAVVDWTARQLRLDAAVTSLDGHALRITGDLPIQLSFAAGGAPISVVENGAMNLRIAAAGFDLKTIEPFLDARTIDQARGALAIDARVGGVANAPQLSGTLALHELTLGLPAMGVRYEKGTVVAHLADDRLTIDTARLRSGDGTMRLTGGLILRQLTLGQFDLHASMHNFRAVWSTAYQVAASGDVAFQGTTNAPAVAGAVTVDQGTLDLSATGSGGNAKPVSLTEAELRSIAARFGVEAVRPGGKQERPFFDKLALNLKVTTDRDAWVRRRANPQLQVELSGTVTARKDPGGPLRLYGTLEPVEGRSYVAQFGRRFTVSEGELTFNGPPQRLRMNIQTQYVVPSTGDPNAAEVTINLDVTGTPDRIRLVLSSDPQMSNSDIVSYIATGHPEAAGLGIGGNSTGSSNLALQAGTSVAVSQLQGVIEGVGQDQLQLDVVEIRQDAVRGATLVAGRYVSPRIYLGFAQPLGFGQAASTAELNRTMYPEAQVEYNAFKWLLLRLEGGVADMRFLLRSRYSY